MVGIVNSDVVVPVKYYDMEGKMRRTSIFILILLFFSTVIFATPQRVIRHINNADTPFVPQYPDRDDPRRDPVDVISYDDDNSLEVFITLPESNGFEDRSYNVRFTPAEAPFELIGLHVALFEMDGRNGNPGMDVAVFSSDDGFPLEEIVSFEVPNDDLVFSSVGEIQWNIISFEDYNIEPLQFEDLVDFHIALNVIQDDQRDTLAVLLDNGEDDPTNRSGFWNEDDNMWELILNAYEVGYNFALRAVVEYPDEGPPVIVINPMEIETENGGEFLIVVTNEGMEPLEWRTEVEILAEPEEPEEPWIVWEEQNGVIEPEDNTEIILWLFSDELVDGMYEADLRFLSNDPENPELAVHISMDVMEIVNVPIIVVDPLAVEAELMIGEIDASIITIGNEGEEALLWITELEIIEEPGEPEQPWSRWQPDRGTVDPGDSGEMLLTLSSAGLIPGVYEAILHFLSNDQENPDVQVRITLQVEGFPRIEVDPAELEFGLIEDPEQRTEILTISNTGDELLIIESVTLAGEYFLTDFDNVMEIEVQESEELTITFTPDESGEYLDTLSILSNDPEMEIALVPIHATYIAPPVIVVSPLIIESVNGGEFDLKIENIGESPLEWQATVDENWISISHSEGQLNFGEEFDIKIGIDTTGLAQDNYGSSD